MKSKNCLIVDDDPLSQRLLESILENIDCFSRIYKCKSVDEAVTLLKNEFIQVVFLDIQMPEKSGLDLLKHLHRHSIQVVIVSSGIENAYHGFEYNSADFILKPPTIDRVQNTIGKLFNRLNQFNEPDERYFFFRSQKSRLEKISADEIYYMESIGNYISIYYGNNSRFITSGTLKSIEARMPEVFVRVHNSYLVRLDKITAIEGNCVIINKKAIPVSRSNWKILNQRLEFI